MKRVGAIFHRATSEALHGSALARGRGRKIPSVSRTRADGYAVGPRYAQVAAVLLTGARTPARIGPGAVGRGVCVCVCGLVRGRGEECSSTCVCVDG